MEKQVFVQQDRFKKSDYQFFVVVADIGGSTAYFAVMGVRDKKRGELILKHSLPTKEITHIHSILNQLLFEAKERFDIEVNRCCIGAAGPVSRKRGYIDLTNASLHINAKEILQNTLLNKVILINDFEAVGYGLDMLELKKDVVTLKHIGKDLTGGWTEGNTFAVIGAGSGLGMTIVPYDFKRHLHIPLPSEGGHMDFSPQDSFELELAQFLRTRAHQSTDIHPEFERVLSGQGMENIYDFLRSQKKQPKSAPLKNVDSLKGTEKLKAIDEHYESDQTCKKTLELFLTFYARAARTLALISECYSGLFITGRIAATHIALLQSGPFMHEFELHDKKSIVLQKIPVYIITNNDVGLYGCCNVAANFYNLGGA